MFFTDKFDFDKHPYTDLACERRRLDINTTGVEYKKELGVVGSWERIRISSKEGAESIGRPIGTYDTLLLERMDLLENEAIEDAADEVARELCYMCDLNSVVPERVLVVGLGNPELTPDSIGPAACRAVKATMQIKSFDKELFEGLECSEIAAVTPDVASKSGFDAADYVKGLCSVMKPDVVFAIDALASRAVSRLGTTVQISDTGIFPGSGIGNHRGAICRESVGVPVIAIGIPTVIDSRMFWLDARGSSEPCDKDASGASMFVCPREIGEIVKVGARIVGEGINQAFGLFY
ncbi:MAG: GPR endopeptidase [Clostridia bacterium]|nr:GPR endopeptidase [Clostridia bacterium]